MILPFIKWVPFCLHKVLWARERRSALGYNVSTKTQNEVFLASLLHNSWGRTPLEGMHRIPCGRATSESAGRAQLRGDELLIIEGDTAKSELEAARGCGRDDATDGNREHALGVEPALRVKQTPVFRARERWFLEREQGREMIV